ncbi:MAG: hypothetical protein KA791_04985 [Flavobacteriales bacterium]|nr:hypothetical protein [Flavobacteriales bacterium]
MRYLVTVCACALVLISSAQPYAIGDRNITFYDAERDRDIACEVHYPALEAGNDMPVEDGQFPVIVIGHGFVMGTDAYAYLWQHYTPLGYIVALPNTEAGFAPDHEAFGRDVAFVASDLLAANDVPSSPFYQHVLPKAVLIGHSMGGGAAFLGAAGNAGIAALVTLAPAETDPSAVAAAPSVLVPTLVFSASEDCVTPIADHQGPMYEALTVPCKAFINITGGGHCYFGDDSFTCSFGELTCGPDLTITREEQHAVVTDMTDLWLRLHVLDEAEALSPLLDSLASTERFIAETTCLSTSTTQAGPPVRELQASVQGDRLLVSGSMAGDLLTLVDQTGRTCWSGTAAGPSQEFTLASISQGAYVLVTHRSASRQGATLVVRR